MINKISIFLIQIVLMGCGAAQIKPNDNYLLEIDFIGENLENRSIDLYVDGELIFENIILKDIPYNVYVFDVGLRYKHEIFELYSLRNDSVLRSKSFEIKELNNIEIEVNINELKQSKKISLKEAKYYQIKLKEGEIFIVQKKNNKIR